MYLENKTNNIEIIYDPVNPEDFEKAASVILASGSGQYPNVALSYLLFVDINGKIINVYCVDGNYKAITYNEETEELYLLSENDIMKIGKTISYVTQQNLDLSNHCRSDIFILEDKIYVESDVVEDERLDFKPDKGYFGYLDISSIGTALHMIPIGIAVVL